MNPLVRNGRIRALAVCGILILAAAEAADASEPSASEPPASGHGPVFGFTTPTNARGGWSLDIGMMGRSGAGSEGVMSRAMLGYGITEDLQISFTVPYVFSSGAFAPSRSTSMMSSTADFEAIGSWRFHRRGTAVGTRVESTAYAGLIVPGPQQLPGMLGDLEGAPGLFTAVATGIASRTHYVWGGVGLTTFAASNGDRRPNLFSYSFVWGYRPPAFQADYPAWDWRIFAEMTGEDSGKIQSAGDPVPGTGGHQIFLGPTALGIYKNIAIEGGVQFPVFRDVGNNFAREKFRYAINFSYFF